MINNIEFEIDFYLLDIAGADAISGVQWLRTLGPITTDLAKLTISFHFHNQPITLTGLSLTQKPSEISLNQLKRMGQNYSISFLYQLQPTTDAQPSQLSTEYPPPLQQLLTHFQHIFQPPNSLPPICPLNHRITLQPNTQPVNVRPYRYPYFQKIEIEKQVQEMLHSRIIQPSTSPFSSSVLLVKKRRFMKILYRL